MNRKFVIFLNIIILSALAGCSEQGSGSKGTSLERYADIITEDDIIRITGYQGKLEKKVMKDPSAGGIHVNFFTEGGDDLILYFGVERNTESEKNIRDQMSGWPRQVKETGAPAWTRRLGFYNELIVFFPSRKLMIGISGLAESVNLDPSVMIDRARLIKLGWLVEKRLQS